MKKVRKPEYYAQQPETFTNEEVISLMHYVNNNYDGYTPIWLLMLTAGLRSGEARKLLWSDIDVHGGFFTVRRETTKTFAGVRVLPISKSLQQWIDTIPTQERVGEVGRNLYGDPVEYNTLQYAWDRLLNAAGVPYKRMHTCRHTIGSYFASEGIPMRSIQALLGHSNIAMTTHYSHQSYEQLKTVFRDISDLAANIAKPSDNKTAD